MIPHHAQFIAALQAQKKVSLRFYSPADRGVLDHVCAPMNYGPGAILDGLNRYWLWDYMSPPGAHTLGLLPSQIVDLQVLGAAFDPAKFIVDLSPTFGAPAVGLPPAPGVSSGGAPSPKL